MFSEAFKALFKEAEFTKEMLGAGATQIRNANYTSKGVYFQAFTSLSTGLERIGKVCLMLDYYLDHDSKFPSRDYMKNEIRHNIAGIYEKSTPIIAKRSFKLRFLQSLDDPVHQAILSVLSGFAQGDRYSNIDLLTGVGQQTDSVVLWHRMVDLPLYETRVRSRTKQSIKENAAVIHEILSRFTRVLHMAETGEEVNDVERASCMTGMYKAVAPYRQLYVLQIIRYWVEFLMLLQDEVMKTGSQDIPYLSEIFALFYNDDSYMRTRKTWDKL
jgi:hypothetical protein